jgi:hypothetical protein
MPEKKQGILDYLTRAGARGVESTLEIPDVLVQGVFGVAKGLKGIQEGAASILGQPKPFQTISIPEEPIGLARRFRERVGLKPIEQLPAKERETEEAKKTLFDPLNYAFFLSEAALKKTALAAAIGGSMFAYEPFYREGAIGHQVMSIGLGEKFRKVFRQWFNKLKPDEAAALLSQDVNLDKAVQFLTGQSDLAGLKAPQELTKAALDWGIASISEETAKAVEKFLQAIGGTTTLPLSRHISFGRDLARTEREQRIGKQALQARPISDWVDTIVDTMDLPVIAAPFRPDRQYGHHYLVAPAREVHSSRDLTYPLTARAVAIQILTQGAEGYRYALSRGLSWNIYSRFRSGHYHSQQLASAVPIDAIHTSYAINQISLFPFAKAFKEWRDNRDQLPLALVFDEIQSDLAQSLFSKHKGQVGRRIAAEATDILPFGKYMEEIARKPYSQKSIFQEFSVERFAQLRDQLDEAVDRLAAVMARVGPREANEYDEERLREMAHLALSQLMLEAKLVPVQVESRRRFWNELIHQEYLKRGIWGYKFSEGEVPDAPHPIWARGAIDYWGAIESIKSSPEREDWSVLGLAERSAMASRFKRSYNLFIPIENFIAELVEGEIIGIPEKLARKAGFSEKEKFNLLVRLQPTLAALAEMSRMVRGSIFEEPPSLPEIMVSSSRLPLHFAGPSTEAGTHAMRRLVQDWSKAVDAANEYATSLWRVYERLLHEFFRPIKPIITEWPKAIVDSVFAVDDEVRTLVDRGDIRYIAMPTPEVVATKYHNAQVRLAPLYMSIFWHNLFTTPERILNKLKKLDFLTEEDLATKEAVSDYLIELSKEQFTPDVINEDRAIGWDHVAALELGEPLGRDFRSRYNRLLRALDSSEIRGMAGGRREPEIISAAISSYLQYLAKLVRSGEVPFAVQRVQGVRHLIIPTYGQYVPTLLTYGIEPGGEWEHNRVLRAVEGLNFEKAVNALTIGRLYQNTVIPLLSAYLKQLGFVRRAEPAYLFLDEQVLTNTYVLNPPDYLPLIVWERP